MNVPAEVHTTSSTIADIATLGPASHSHSDSGPISVSASQVGGVSMLHSPSLSPNRWIRPRGSANQVGGLNPTADTILLTAPVPVNRNRNTRLIATELVTDGK